MKFIKFMMFCFKQWFSVRFEAKIIIVVPDVFMKTVDIDEFFKTLQANKRKMYLTESKSNDIKELDELKRYKNYTNTMYSYKYNSLLSKSSKAKLK